jgi:hypothetical protein
MAEPERIVELSRTVSLLASEKIKTIKTVTGATKILALNALIEATRAGEAGRGFAVVAGEVKQISTQISAVTHELEQELTAQINELTRLGEHMVSHIRGTRLTDLAFNMIEIIDRNLYERSCDVRWWATDSAVVDCLTNQSADTAAFATRRLGVILDAYTVYLDLWVADAQGRVIATGRPDLYPRARGMDVSRASWFRDAMATRDGGEFAVADIEPNEGLGGKLVATYATAIREGGEQHGKPLGALGIFFDWNAQSETVVKGVRLTPEEQERTRCLLIDSQGRIIATSDGKGTLTESFQLQRDGQDMGSYVCDKGQIVGYALTPGYETYRGLGWYGVIVQKPLDA